MGRPGRHGRQAPLHRAKASSLTWSSQARQVSIGRCRTSCPIACWAARQPYECVSCCIMHRGPCRACPCMSPSELPLPPLLVRGVNRVAWHCSRCRASLRVPSGLSERSFYVLYSGLDYATIHAKKPRGTARSPLSPKAFPMLVMSG